MSEKLLKVRQHPTTSYLEIVLKEREGYRGKEYVTRIRNKECGGEYHGHYFSEDQYSEALNDFYTRS